MIFVTVGTQPQPLARLFHEIINLVDNNLIEDEIVCQSGSFKINHPKIKSFDFIPFTELNEYLKKADLIISHGGTGSLIPLIKKNKKVIDIPRLKEFGEHLNDHQKDLIDELAKGRHIIPLYDVKDLHDAIKKSETFSPSPFVSGTETIINDLRTYINSL